VKTNHLIVLGTLLVALGYGIGRYTYGLFVPDIRESLNLSTSAIGLVASASHLGYITAILLCMQLIRFLSPRMLMMLGALSGAAGLLLIPFADSALVLALGLFTASMSAGWIWTATPDAVRQLLPENEHNHVLSWTNSGTGVGVLIAAPIAFLLPDWRVSYVAYGVFAIMLIVWAWRALPPMSADGTARSIPLRWGWFVCPRSAPLLGMAMVMGLVAAIYWTFAVDLIVVSGMDASWIGQFFWFVSGVAGVLGIAVAMLIRRYGIRHVIPLNAIVLAAALGLLAVAPTSLFAIVLSAIFFGAGFISITGLLTIWSIRIYARRPSAGLGAVLILIAAGQVIGPVIAGFLAEQSGLIPVFFGGALLALASMVLRPQPNDALRRTQAHPAS